MNDQPNNIISFSEFEIDTVHRRLLRDGETVPLHAKAFDLLCLLALNNGRTVTKDEILDSVWESQFVEESNLVVQISNLRKALGETKNSPRFLVTVPGKGYKFVADVDENTLIIETHSVSKLTIEQEEIIPAIVEKKRFSLKWIVVAGFAVFGLVGIGYFWKNSQPIQNKQLRLTKLTNSGRIVNVTMSPDGNFAVFAQKDEIGESLWLHQLETGSEKQIVEPQPLNYVGLTVSPDNQFIYASKFLKNDIDLKLEKIPLLGGNGQIMPISTGIAISISPDGKRFAFTESSSKTNETLLGISDINVSNPVFLKRAKTDVRYYPIFQSSPLAWSPDGHQVAVAVNEKIGNDQTYSILLVNPNDGSEVRLSDKRWRELDNLAWLDSDRLAFIGKDDDDLPSQIWLVSRQTGAAKQLTTGLQNYDWLAAGNGKILTTQINSFSGLRVADFNETDNSLKIREIFTASDYIDELDWGKNGEIIYASRASGKRELWRMNSDGSNPKILTKNANLSFGLAVSPFDESIVFSSKQNGIRGIWQVDADGGGLRRINEGGIHPDVSNDGKIVFQHGSDIILNSNGVTKKLREKCSFPTISPDGTKTACYFMDFEEDRKWRIALISNDSGDLIQKISLPVPIYDRHIRWHRSGKYITQIFSEGEKLKMIFFPIENGEPKIIEGLGKGESNLPEWSPDGNKFLYPLITTSQDVVVLTDF